MLGVGFDKVHLETATAQGIPVCNVPDYGTEEVADTAVAMLLAHQRKLALYHAKARVAQAAWDWRIHIPIRRSSAMQVGIIGLGRLGAAVAQRLKPFGYRLSFYDPLVSSQLERESGLMRVATLDELLRASDAVTIHTPLNEATAGLIDERFFSLLKPHAILVNTSRGGLFRSADVIERALRERAGLRIGSDVWPNEPPPDHSLVSAWREGASWLEDRLILCPHAAFYSEESLIELRRLAVEIVKTILAGGQPYHVVNPEARVEVF
jgi:D-3-phosphoglycerate dehydrogenase